MLLWLANRGGRLHHRFAEMIEYELRRFLELERQGKREELERIRKNAPNAVPRPEFRVLWRLLLDGRIGLRRRDPDLYRWKDQFQRDGLTATIRFKLRELLTPKVVLKEPFHWGYETADANGNDRLRQGVDWELVLNASDVKTSLADISETELWRKALVELFDDFQQLLRDALDLRRELGEDTDRNDYSHWGLPSVQPHWQNRDHHEGVALIELLRDAWLQLLELDPPRAQRNARTWVGVPHATFKRLAFFAASYEEVIEPDEWVDWLLADQGWWLWRFEMMRETLRLLVLRGRDLTPTARERLEAAILLGPPRSMFRPELEPDEWSDTVDRSVWLHLEKLRSSGAALGQAADDRLSDISKEHPRWKLDDDQKDEFPHWISGTGDPDYDDTRERDRAPRKRKALVDWLQRQPPREDDWPAVCRSRFFHASLALCDLANEGKWPTTRWNEAFHAWSEEKSAIRSWRFLARLVQTMPDECLPDVAHGITRWLQETSKSLDCHEPVFLDLCRRILEIPLQDGVFTDEPLTRAINHPVDHVADALLSLWFGRKPNDNEGLPPDLEALFSMLCDTSIERYRHGRVLLASRVIPFFRVDRKWTETKLLPLFSWSTDSIEARAAWAGFLWGPRLYQPLLESLKKELLETVQHLEDLGDRKESFVSFLTFAALAPTETFPPEDYRKAFAALSQEGLRFAAHSVFRALESAGGQREEYWINRVQPFWQKIWPKSRHLAARELSGNLATVCVAAGTQFPAAVSAISPWLSAIEHPGYQVKLLYEAKLCAQFPESGLSFLDVIIASQLQWPSEDLRPCLSAILQAQPTLSEDFRYRRLDELCRKFGK